MDNKKLESGIIDLICFMAVGARELMNDPKIYGPMRLMEATQRLADLAEECGVPNEMFAEVSKRIEEAPMEGLPNDGEEEFVQFMDDLVTFLVEWVKKS